MRGRNLRRTLVAAGLVAASAVLVLVLAVAGLLAFIVTPICLLHELTCKPLLVHLIFLAKSNLVSRYVNH